jgi:hypothetical protein
VSTSDLGSALQSDGFKTELVTQIVNTPPEDWGVKIKEGGCGSARKAAGGRLAASHVVSHTVERGQGIVSINPLGRLRPAPTDFPRAPTGETTIAVDSDGTGGEEKKVQKGDEACHMRGTLAPDGTTCVCFDSNTYAGSHWCVGGVGGDGLRDAMRRTKMGRGPLAPAAHHAPAHLFDCPAPPPPFAQTHQRPPRSNYTMASGIKYVGADLVAIGGVDSPAECALRCADHSAAGCVAFSWFESKQCELKRWGLGWGGVDSVQGNMGKKRAGCTQRWAANADLSHIWRGSAK